MITLAPQQTQAFDKIMTWLRDRDSKRFVLSGYAGTGKTSLARHIASCVENVIFVAFTGKAASVLREKGCEPAGTIHSYLYKPEKGSSPVRFTYLPSSEIMSADLVICDEYSMVNMDLVEHLEGAAKKVLYLGDDFQLPPVNGGNNLLPDFRLTDVHRQALESNLIRVLTGLRNGTEPAYCDFPDFIFQRKATLDPAIYKEVDQIICGENKTRVKWTLDYRGPGLPIKGERVQCLKNDGERGLFNGMTAIVQEDVKAGRVSDIVLDIGTFKCATENFWTLDTQDKGYARDVTFWRYACVTTTHKSQGSEWDTVLVYDEPIGRTNIEKMRWRYTALSRARKKVWLVN